MVVWRILADQFQGKTWANKLEVKQKLFSLRLVEGSLMQEHIKLMTEIYEELSVIGEAISEEDRLVYLLASLPESYNVLVTALEASADVPTLVVVREHLLHEETKIKSRSNQLSQEGALTTSFKKKLRCHFCNKLGYFKKACEEFAKVKSQAKPAQARKKNKMGAFKVTNTAEDESSADSESTGLMAQHALPTKSNTHDQWITDLGATCHMCNKKELLPTFRIYKSH